jgi:hypothetical protein
MSLVLTCLSVKLAAVVAVVTGKIRVAH